MYYNMLVCVVLCCVARSPAATPPAVRLFPKLACCAFTDWDAHFWPRAVVITWAWIVS